MCQKVLNFFMRNLVFKNLRKTKVFLSKVFLSFLFQKIESWNRISKSHTEQVDVPLDNKK